MCDYSIKGEKEMSTVVIKVETMDSETTSAYVSVFVDNKLKVNFIIDERGAVIQASVLLDTSDYVFSAIPHTKGASYIKHELERFEVISILGVSKLVNTLLYTQNRRKSFNNQASLRYANL